MFCGKSELMRPTLTSPTDGDNAKRSAPNAKTSETAPSAAAAMRTPRVRSRVHNCRVIATAAGSSSNRKLIPQGPVIDASCSTGRNFSCE